MEKKRTWKLGMVRNAAPSVMASAKTVAAAARELGVDRSTVHRWIQAKKIPAPTGKAARLGKARTAPGASVGRVQTPEEWAHGVEETYSLSGTERQLLALAVLARTMADDAALAPAVRLQAAGRFAALVKQLNLETEEAHDGAIETPVAPWPRRVS
jgi:excisionase family DNA binding protein